MSKHDSSGKRADDPSEQLLSSDAFTAEKSGISKEIKISLAAITVLLGVLGYVLYGHFFASAEDDVDISVAAADEGQSAGEITPPSVSLSPSQPLPPAITTTTGSNSALATDTSPTDSRWAQTGGQGQKSASQTGTEDTSSGFSFMPSATPRAAQTQVSQTATDSYAAYGGSPTAGTSTSNWPSNTASGSNTYGGQTNDPFQQKAAQETAGGNAPQPYGGTYTSLRQTDGQAVQPYNPSASSSQPYNPSDSNSQPYNPSDSNSQPYNPSTTSSQPYNPSTASSPAVQLVRQQPAVLLQLAIRFPYSRGRHGDGCVRRGGTPASSEIGQSSPAQSRTFQQGTSSDHAATGSSLQIQPTSQYSKQSSSYPTERSTYSTDSRDYAAANTYGNRSGTSSTPIESQTSSPDYGTGTQPSAPQTSAGFSAASTSPDSSKYAFPDDDASDGKYTIQPNDNYSVISKKLYHTEGYFRALAEHNRATFADPNRLDVGKEIEVPDVAELERAYPQLCPTPQHRDAIKHRKLAAGKTEQPAGATVYVVQEGDTLFDIARYELGKASRWAEIYQINRDRLGKDFDYLTPGLKLVMPSDQPVGIMTQRSGALRKF